MMLAVFIAGVIVGWAVIAAGLAYVVGAGIAIADQREHVEPEPVYVPQEWSA